MNKLGRFSRLTTSFALVVMFLIALAVQANYNIYVWRESGGTGGGAWYQYVGTATSGMGGNIGVNSQGTMLLDNRTPSGPATTIYYAPTGGHCVPRCQNLF